MLPSVALKCHNLVKRFDGIRAVDGLSVAFEAGRVNTLIGPNGAGKTTLFHLIAGTLQPEAGEIWYRGQRIDRLPPWRIARLGIGRLFQEVRIFPRLSVLDNLLLAFPNQLGENVAWSLLRRPAIRRQEQENGDTARQCLRWVGLDRLEATPAQQLSYGQQKLLAITRLLAADTDVMLLDEPTAGVNPETSRVILTLIKALTREKNKTVVMIEHNMSVVLEVADCVMFMDEGLVVAAGLPETVLGDHNVRASYLGL